MMQYECLKGAIVKKLDTIAFGISGSIGLRVKAMQPIGEAFFIYDEH
jgi:hypothetical protein